MATITADAGLDKPKKSATIAFEKATKLILFILSLTLFACNKAKPDVSEQPIEPTEEGFCNPLLPVGADPWAIYHNGIYYYMQGYEDRIALLRTNDLTRLEDAEKKEIWLPHENSNAHHLWGPEIHYINNKWYVYFAADGGNTDDHQIYVIENTSQDPFEGKFTMKGRIKTDAEDNWAIHATVFQHQETLYMLWSGWQTRRVETEKQCIYIARMKNPWTLDTDRVLISQPELEWERQWVNPDGSKTAYPIYVNEAPQFFYSKNKDKALVFYSASGTWTPYYAIGMLVADVDSDLLNPASWVKSKQPVFRLSEKNKVYGPGNIAFIPSPDSAETYFLYHARNIENGVPGSRDMRTPRMQKLEWDENGLPVFGEPAAEGEKLKMPSGK